MGPPKLGSAAQFGFQGAGPGDEFLGDTLVRAVKRQNRLPHGSRGIDALRVEQTLEEMDGDVQVLVRKGENWQNLLEEVPGGLAVTRRVEAVDTDIDGVQRGGHEGVHATVQGLDHLHDRPAT